MAIFLNLYFYIPKSDLKKTTLNRGNPHRFDHLLLGGVVRQGSLYKAPKEQKFTQVWLWDDDMFDPMDPQPSEQIVIKFLFDLLSQEMERVINDKQVTFPAHYVVGNELQRQLGFLYSKAYEYGIAGNETLFHVILGATALELSQIAAAKQKKMKNLKPVYLNSLSQQFGFSPFVSQEQISKLYEKMKYDDLEKTAELEISNLLQIYYHLNTQ